MRLANSTLIAILACSVMALCKPNPAPSPRRCDFAPIFDGKTLQGWHISAKSGHGGTDAGSLRTGRSRPSGPARQRRDHHHRRQYGDFEVLENDNDFGPDSGLFLRSTEDGVATRR